MSIIGEVRIGRVLLEMAGYAPDLSRNTNWMMAWGDRMRDGHGIRCAIEALCKRMGEEGQDDPSDAAVKQAKRWEANPKACVNHILKKGCPIVCCGSFPCEIKKSKREIS